MGAVPARGRGLGQDHPSHSVIPGSSEEPERANLPPPKKEKDFFIPELPAGKSGIKREWGGRGEGDAGRNNFIDGFFPVKQQSGDWEKISVEYIPCTHSLHSYSHISHRLFHGISNVRQGCEVGGSLPNQDIPGYSRIPGFSSCDI